MSTEALEQSGFASGVLEVRPLARGAAILSTTVEMPTSIGDLVRGYQEAAKHGIARLSTAAIDATVRQRDEPAAGWQSFVEAPVNPDVDTINPGY